MLMFRSGQQLQQSAVVPDRYAARWSAVIFGVPAGEFQRGFQKTCTTTLNVLILLLPQVQYDRDHGVWAADQSTHFCFSSKFGMHIGHQKIQWLEQLAPVPGQQE